MVAEKEGYYYSSPSCTNISKSGESAVYLHRENGWSKRVDYCNDWGSICQIIDKIWDELMFISCGCYQTIWVEIMDVYKCSKMKAAAIIYLEMD